MGKVQLFKPAPDLDITDMKGNLVKLSDYKNKNNVLLIFNRGFF